MNKSIALTTLLISGATALDWATRCEYADDNCSGRIISCVQFKLTDGCANDGTGFAMAGSELTVEADACSTGSLVFTDAASKISSGSCVTTVNEIESIEVNTYARYFATDDGTDSLRSYTLEDLAKCANGIYASPNDADFLDSYTLHSDAFTCTSNNLLNRYSYLSTSGVCDENGAKPILDGIRLDISEYETQEDCEAGAGEFDSYYYRTDGSCHIGMFQAVKTGLFHSHVELCGEPAGANTEVETTPAVCGVALTKSSAMALSTGLAAVVVAASLAIRA